MLHPIVVVRRAPDGKLADVLPAPTRRPAAGHAGRVVDAPGVAPLAVSAEGSKRSSPGCCATCGRSSRTRSRCANAPCEIADALAGQPPAPADRADVASLLRWLVDGHLTFLGYRHHVAGPDGDLRPDSASGLGMLRDGTRGADIGAVPASPAAPRAPGDHPGQRPEPAQARAPVLPRRADLRRRGPPPGEHRFLGTLTVPALYESVLDIPVVERRVPAPSTAPDSRWSPTPASRCSR